MVEIDYGTCDECGTCISVCAFDALSMTPGLVAAPRKCTSCGKCVKVCPFGALKLGDVDGAETIASQGGEICRE